MKQLVCEMCGSKDLLKQDGVFVCQSCGTKYSVEEARKMMIEGTVEVAGTVMIDDSAKIENYYTIAQHAYDSNNLAETESYCNKIIEINPEYHRAWLLKGRAAGWQSTLANMRLDEAINCFERAINFAPETMVEAITGEAIDAFSELSVALVSMCCKNFSEDRSRNNADTIQKTTKTVIQYGALFQEKANVEMSNFPSSLADKIGMVALAEYVNIAKAYVNSRHPSEKEWEQYVKQSQLIHCLLDYAIELQTNTDTLIQYYTGLIDMLEQVEASHSYIYYNDVGWREGRSLPREQRVKIINWIMAYHHKIKEIDATYEVPPRPELRTTKDDEIKNAVNDLLGNITKSQPTQSTSNQSGGCYVATAVYGSYDCPQVWTLRRFRDNTLAKTWYGRFFIRSYYTISPTLVKLFGKTEWFRKFWKCKLDRMVVKLNVEGVENTPYEDRIW